MAILGLSGMLELVREYPDPQTFLPSGLNKRLDAIQTRGTAFSTGDRVLLFCERGLPTRRTPAGMAQWAGVGYNDLGPTRQHIANDASPFWLDDDTAPHWEELESTDIVQEWYYIHIDEFDRVSFYSTMEQAMEGDARFRLPIARVAWGELLMAATPQDPYILNAATNGDETYDDLPYDYAEIGIVNDQLKELFKREWSFACSLREWSFETNSAAIDTTPIGVRFGEAVKSIVTATGNLDFMVRRQDNGWSGLKTMRLALLVDKGSVAHARFVLTPDDAESCGTGRSIYYEADLLVTTCSLSARLDDALVGSAAFATTGPVSLKIGNPLS